MVFGRQDLAEIGLRCRGQLIADDSVRWGLVDANTGAIRQFLEWSAMWEGSPGGSKRWDARSDIDEARSILPLFDEAWWAIVVYTCFNSIIGTKAVALHFRAPTPSERAATILASLSPLPAGSVGMHRIQPAHKGAKQALVSACANHQAFQEILEDGSGFHDRYQRVRALHAPSWGRTTCFDLLLRSGALAVGGERYEPEYAYLVESQGPSKGFREIWGLPIRDPMVGDGEELLRWWASHWEEVARRAGARAYPQPPYRPGDFENALCIYQEHPRKYPGTLSNDAAT